MKELRKCKNIKDIINLFTLEKIKYFSYILLMIWCSSPIVVYFLKFIFKTNYFQYAVLIINTIGIIGILNYIIIRYKYKNKEYNNFFFKIIFILIIISILATIFSSNPLLSLFGETYRNEGLITYIFYSCFIFAAFLIDDEKQKNNIVKSIIFSTFFLVIMQFFMTNNLREIFFEKNWSNIFFNSNHYGYFLMIGCSLSMYKFIQSKKIKDLIIFIVILFFLIYNNTLGCYLGLLISFILYLIFAFIKKYNIKNTLIALVAFIIVTCIPFNSMGNNIVYQNFKNLFEDSLFVVVDHVKDKNVSIDKIGTDRGGLWKNSIKFSLEHPLLGDGFECLTDYFFEIELYQSRPHNILLQTSCFIGIPGAIIYLIFLICLAFKNMLILKEKNEIQISLFFTCIAYFISSLFGNSMFYTSPFFMIFIGMLIKYYIKYNKQKKHE